MSPPLVRSIAVLLVAAAMACAPKTRSDADAVASCRIFEEGDSREVYVPPGEFHMGDTRFYPEEGPRRRVALRGFYIDRTEVTNADFARFVAATGYLTQAERGLGRDVAPEIADAFRVPGSMVFSPPDSLANASSFDWWRFTPGANWRHPHGPESSIEGREKYPVVHITQADAEAYARWAGRRLPTEEEWEYAALGRDVVLPGEIAPTEANVWQGLFPLIDEGSDGFVGLAPVGCFPPNGYGIYDMVGNVWELTATYYYPGHDGSGRRRGDGRGYDPAQPGVPVYVIKGGSYLCAPNFCKRYRPQARHPQDALLGSTHIGFRTVRDN